MMASDSQRTYCKTNSYLHARNICEVAGTLSLQIRFATNQSSNVSDIYFPGNIFSIIKFDFPQPFYHLISKSQHKVVAIKSWFIVFWIMRVEHFGNSDYYSSDSNTITLCSTHKAIKTRIKQMEFMVADYINH